MNGIVGYAKNSELSQIDKCANLMSRHDSAKLSDTFRDDKVEFALAGLNAQNSVYNSIGGGGNHIHLALCGKCYNLDKLNTLFQTSYQTFFDIICHAYKQNHLIELLNKVDGCFNFVLYDSQKQKLIVANDRFGLNPLYVYSHNSNFAFTGELKALLLLDFVDKSIDSDSFEMFMSLGYLLGSHTWFKHIKRLAPASIVECDLATKRQIQKHYWTFAEVKKENISFDNAVDKAHTLFKDAIKRQVDLELNPSVLLSGGSDSRLCLAAMNEIYPHYKPYTATFGVKNCLDFILAQKVCDCIGTKNNEFLFENIDWLNLRKECLYSMDCAHSLMHLHGCEFDDLFPHDSRLIVNGYLGDAVFGDSYLPDKRFYDTRVNAKIAEFYYGDYAEFSEYNDEYYNVENPLPLHWINRGSNFINMAVSTDVGRSSIACRPFFDNKIIEFICSLPNEYLFEYKLYKHLVLRHYPKFFKHIGRNSLMPLYTNKGLSYRAYKIKFKINKKLQKLGFIPKVIESYTEYDKWITQEPYKSQIQAYLSSKDAYYKRFSNEIMNLYMQKEKDGYADKILKLVSVEMYFGGLSKNL